MSFPQPPLPALHPGEDPLGIEPLQRITGLLLDRPVLAALITSGRSLELALKPLTTTSLRRQLRRQLVTPRVLMLLVLGLVGRDRLSDDLPRNPVIVDVRVTARARRHLRAIDRDHPRLHQPRPSTQPQHRRKQLTQ